MHDLRVVRAEVKAWERDFRSRNARDPSVQDIRDHPAIAEKYKLYKKLSKAAAVSSQPAAGPSSHVPSTSPVATIPKSRAVQSVAPIPGFNPFSPLKKKGKKMHSPPPSQAPQNTSSANPFATPAKYTSNHPLHSRTPSPDPFPSILLPPQKSASSLPYDPPPSNVAVSRARKRLRGEPVSPSPNKQKRQRVGDQLSQPFLSMHSSSSDHEPEPKLPEANFNSSFVDDSPIKPPVGGKSFKLLFEDALPALPVPKKISEPVLSQPTIPSLDMQSAQRASRDPKATSMISTSGRKGNLAHARLSQPRSSLKRGLDRAGFVPDAMQSMATSYEQYSLFPPSPPRDVSTSSRGGEYKGKGKNTGPNRKRARLGDGKDEDESDSPDDDSVKVVVRNHGKQRSNAADALALDPLLNFGARNHDPNATGEVDVISHDSGTFTVDLPDKLRLVLAISPSRSHTSKEERVVRGLLNGDRVGHYDASKGGNIWDVGEWDDAVHVDTEAEDDWEGEPVPWEVGEL